MIGIGFMGASKVPNARRTKQNGIGNSVGLYEKKDISVKVKRSSKNNKTSDAWTRRVGVLQREKRHNKKDKVSKAKARKHTYFDNWQLEAHTTRRFGDRERSRAEEHSSKSKKQTSQDEIEKLFMREGRGLVRIVVVIGEAFVKVVTGNKDERKPRGTQTVVTRTEKR
ncbi:hypothetical protein CC1G_13851 [Coprinopsis cinerea okayama7|uniref:Uncharacterized protein n=1 Tax=Coprinopsis cinerea (strain Okayama-7 / 130 / ATCC MYA-4618 / FGSC 9003) TaxID=240176 RepID=D6RKV3_COPC7|nr:hypothetical protein CC1G_13851 [Coprinopsis cinerea okayama7\|eukprot:XP_002911816.1 hypothetical protein CC1G_13851 [Coprinopsis cinerea okayama7\